MVGGGAVGLEGLIVAAGRSERMEGRYKMALELGGRTVIENTVAGMAAVCSRVIVVSGYNANILQGILQNNKRVEIVHNPNYNNGMYSSVLTGLKHISSSRFFFSPGDYPLITADVYQAMMAVHADILIPSYKGQPGHPVLFSRRTAEKILADNSCTNLREFIATQDPVFLEVGCPAILMDMDTVEDYWRLKAMAEKSCQEGMGHGAY